MMKIQTSGSSSIPETIFVTTAAAFSATGAIAAQNTQHIETNINTKDSSNSYSIKQLDVSVSSELFNCHSILGILANWQVQELQISGKEIKKNYGLNPDILRLSLDSVLVLPNGFWINKNGEIIQYAFIGDEKIINILNQSNVNVKLYDDKMPGISADYTENELKISLRITKDQLLKILIVISLLIITILRNIYKKRNFEDISIDITLFVPDEHEDNFKIIRANSRVDNSEIDKLKTQLDAMHEMLTSELKRPSQQITIKGKYIEVHNNFLINKKEIINAIEGIRNVVQKEPENSFVHKPKKEILQILNDAIKDIMKVGVKKVIMEVLQLAKTELIHVLPKISIYIKLLEDISKKILGR